MSNNFKVIIVAPFWRNPPHVGIYRIDRFVRWLSTQGVNITLVRAGSTDQVQQMSWGVEVTVRDPLELYGDPVAGGGYTTPTRRPNRLRRFAAYLLFNPDPTVVWAKRAAYHPLVLEHGQGATCVLSSNPPESSHVASSLLAKQLQTDLIVDMRDGWLDEPLKPLLQHFRWQRWREGRLETPILRQAKHIFVSSVVWKDLLENRLPFTKGKTTVLTNGYPPESLRPAPTGKKCTAFNRITLLYAGQFTGSRNTRKVQYLLKPLLEGIQCSQSKGDVVLLGNLEEDDLTEVNHWKPQLEALGWSVVVQSSVPRLELLERLHQADGLLLLSVSPATIPSKLFEYLTSGRPILCLTPEGSALWQLGESLPQVFLLDDSQHQKVASIVKDFLAVCVVENLHYEIPPDFTEESLSKIFLQDLGLANT